MPKLSIRHIGIVGSRDRSDGADWIALTRAFDAIYRPGDRIVSGGCKLGADSFAEVIAAQRGLSILIHHANWDKLGNSAGPIRNTLIAEDCHILIALPSRKRKGGTDDTIAKATKLGKKIILA